jgi:hypothetical protein
MSTPLAAYGYPLAVDVSDWQGTITVAELEEWHALGITRLIARTFSRAYAGDVLTRARAVGMQCEAYTYLYWGRTAAQLALAIDVAHEHGILRLWLDCEDPFTDADAVLGEIQDCVWDVGAAGIAPGIYAGRYWWQALGNPTTWAHLPLWMPNYGTGGWAPPITSPGYGGWTAQTLVMHQCTSTPPGGIPRANLDISYIYDGGDMALADDVAAIKALLQATGVEQAGAEGIDLLQSIRNTQHQQTQHQDQHPGGSIVTPHTHTGEVTVT